MLHSSRHPAQRISTRLSTIYIPNIARTFKNTLTTNTCVTLAMSMHIYRPPSNHSSLSSPHKPHLSTNILPTTQPSTPPTKNPHPSYLKMHLTTLLPLALLAFIAAASPISKPSSTTNLAPRDDVGLEILSDPPTAPDGEPLIVEGPPDECVDGSPCAS